MDVGTGNLRLNSPDVSCWENGDASVLNSNDHVLTELVDNFPDIIYAGFLDVPEHPTP
jgi:hypothetical protein